MSESERYKMIDELAESYRFEQDEDGGAEIVIRTSARFADLWLIKLNELTATEKEIREYEPRR